MNKCFNKNTISTMSWVAHARPFYVHIRIHIYIYILPSFTWCAYSRFLSWLPIITWSWTRNKWAASADVCAYTLDDNSLFATDNTSIDWIEPKKKHASTRKWLFIVVKWCDEIVWRSNMKSSAYCYSRLKHKHATIGCIRRSDDHRKVRICIDWSIA